MREPRYVIGYSIIAVVSFFSIISSVYVCWSILKSGYISGISCKNYRYNPTKHDEYKHSIMTNIIFWICITDIFSGLSCLLKFTPQIFTNPNYWFYDGYNGITCQILAIEGIFFRIQNSLLHIILAYNFLYLLRLKSLQKLLKYQRIYHYLAVIVRLQFIFLNEITFTN